MSTTTFVPADLDASNWDNVRPLIDDLKSRDVGSPDDLKTWLEDRSELEAACSESAARLFIDMTCDTADEGRSKRYLAYVENVQPKLRTEGFELDKKQAKLAEEHGLTDGRHEVLHRDTKADVDLFREENVPLLTKITKLDQQYDTVNGAMTVEFEGEERTMPQMARYFESTDRDLRERAWRAAAERRLQDRDAIDGIYDEMIGLRDKVAKNAGFDNYVGYAFTEKHRFDYTPDSCRAFHDGVEQHVMPFVARLDERRKAELGLDTLRPWDTAVDPKGRDALRPFEGGVELVSKSQDVFDRLDPELAGMFAQLGDGSNTKGIENGDLLDLDSRKGKAPGGYQYMQDRSRKPFIFMNAAGLHRDLETMVHEAGHAFHSMLCIDEPLLHYRHSPIEFAEVASMSMELLTMPFWDAYYPDESDLARARRKQIEGSVSTLAWIATIDAFQHWVYENPTHNRTQRTDAWLNLDARFGSAGHRIDWTDLQDAREAGWQKQGHLFGVPFYYIEYGIAGLGALQLWMRALDEGPDVALASYKKALSLGGSRPLPELFEAAGLVFDFGPEVIGKVVERAEAELAKIPE